MLDVSSTNSPGDAHTNDAGYDDQFVNYGVGTGSGLLADVYGDQKTESRNLSDEAERVGIPLMTPEKPWPLLKHPSYFVVLLVIAYSLVASLGIVNNILIVIVVSTQTALRTVTNCFLANLAVADILVCIVVLPITLLENIFTGKTNRILCKRLQ